MDYIYRNVIEKKSLWKEVAKEFNGTFFVKSTVSKDLNTLVLEIPHNNNILILTETDTKPLKSETILHLDTKFILNISIENTFEKIVKLFGNNDIEIGIPEFDNKYFIHSNIRKTAIEILQKINVKNILRLNIYSISLQPANSQTHILRITKDKITKTKMEMIDFINLNLRFIDYISQIQ